MNAGDEHVLYRFFDADGRLLYVGITFDPEQRWKQHAGDKFWWRQVATLTIERFPDRGSVLAAEKLAIIRERPKYNSVHNGGGFFVGLLDRMPELHPFDELVTPARVKATRIRRYGAAQAAYVALFLVVGYILVGLKVCEWLGVQVDPSVSGALAVVFLVGLAVGLVVRPAVYRRADHLRFLERQEASR